jgi:hypothetical protein
VPGSSNKCRTVKKNRKVTNLFIPHWYACGPPPNTKRVCTRSCSQCMPHTQQICSRDLGSWVPGPQNFDGLMRLMIRDSRKSAGMRRRLSNDHFISYFLARKFAKSKYQRLISSCTKLTCSASLVSTQRCNDGRRKKTDLRTFGGS